jgi:hypothetical protein
MINGIKSMPPRLQIHWLEPTSDNFSPPARFVAESGTELFIPNERFPKMFESYGKPSRNIKKQIASLSSTIPAL